ncbi:hypothetical protein D4764_15G0009600 [Takifugu flavidus]|uniref:Reverse transcriptase domain-containing protein n=1 Tax=Takifugu flavidus TaxID=433684 RepID=A0A5C6P385_9TELE|nr:hypothetical protein D4764_15G0009600 [Takifugu flavidus]
MNEQGGLLLRARNTAFRSGDVQAYSTARDNLRRGIKKAKHTYKCKIEALSRINPRKAGSPDSIPGRVLRACAEQLAGITAIVPVPKHSKLMCLNDYRPVALTSIIMKCFEGLVLAHLKLIIKLGELGIDSSFCNSTMDFLTNRPQHVRSGHSCSTTITLSTDLYMDPTPSSSLQTVIGLISNNDQMAYREEVKHLTMWCTDNNLLLNTSKTKKLIVDFRKARGGKHDPIHINGMAVECISSFKFLETHLGGPVLDHKYLQHDQESSPAPHLPGNTEEEPPVFRRPVWYGSCTIAEHKALQRVVKTAQRITGTPLPAIEDVQKKRCLH